MTREERRRRREERKAKRAAKKKALDMPDVVELKENTDPLQLYDSYGNEIEPVLRGLWRGKSAFLVGFGPSLNQVPYERLAERGVASLGINNVAGYAPVSAMTFSDPPEKFHHGIFFDPNIMKIVPRQKLGKRVRAKLPDGQFKFTSYRVADCPNVWGYKRNCEFDAASFLTCDAATWGNNGAAVKKNGLPKCIFTFFCALRLIHFLGPRRVYLLGVDFSMPNHGDQYGNYSFHEIGCSDGNHDHYRVCVQFLTMLKPYFDEDGFEIYQTNPLSRLSLYPHIPFDEALADCKSPVPELPFDLSEWYRYKGIGHAPKGSENQDDDDDSR